MMHADIPYADMVPLTPAELALASEVERRAAAQETYVLAHSLCATTADLLGVPFADAWQSLITIPDNMLSLLHSPQGWSALSGMIAIDVGAPGWSLVPTLH